MPDTKVTDLNHYKFHRALPHIQKLHSELELEAYALRGLSANPRCVPLSGDAVALNARQRAEMLSFGQTTMLLAMSCLILWAGIGAALVWYINGGAW